MLFEIEALMDEEIETFEQESEVPAGSPGDGRRLSAGIWYCRGGNGRCARAGLGGPPGGGTRGAHRQRDGGDFPRHSAGLWIYLATIHAAAAKKAPRPSR